MAKYQIQKQKSDKVQILNLSNPSKRLQTAKSVLTCDITRNLSRKWIVLFPMPKPSDSKCQAKPFVSALFSMLEDPGK